MTFFGNTEVDKIWKKETGVEEFMYWDNTYPPEGMTEKQFKKRGHLWNKLCPYTPVECGMNISTHTQFTSAFINFDEMIKYQNTKENRVKLVVENQLRDDYMNPRKNEFYDENNHVNWSKWFKIDKEYRNSEKDQEKINEYTEKANSLLPDKYTMDIYRKVRDDLEKELTIE